MREEEGNSKYLERKKELSILRNNAIAVQNNIITFQNNLIAIQNNLIAERKFINKFFIESLLILSLSIPQDIQDLMKINRGEKSLIPLGEKKLNYFDEVRVSETFLVAEYFVDNPNEIPESYEEFLGKVIKKVNRETFKELRKDSRRNTIELTEEVEGQYGLSTPSIKEFFLPREEARDKIQIVRKKGNEVLNQIQNLHSKKAKETIMTYFFYLRYVTKNEIDYARAELKREFGQRKGEKMWEDMIKARRLLEFLGNDLQKWLGGGK